MSFPSMADAGGRTVGVEESTGVTRVIQSDLLPAPELTDTPGYLPSRLPSPVPSADRLPAYRPDSSSIAERVVDSTLLVIDGNERHTGGQVDEIARAVRETVTT